jgi:hypothetical protein
MVPQHLLARWQKVKGRLLASASRPDWSYPSELISDYDLVIVLTANTKPGGSMLAAHQFRRRALIAGVLSTACRISRTITSARQLQLGIKVMF